MHEIVIAGALRTPQGKLGGALKEFTNQKLGAILLRGLIERNKIPSHAIDEVIFGCVGQQSDAHNVARVISSLAGIPNQTPAFTVSRNCGSGLQAIVSGIYEILSGDAEMVVAGGVEVMSSSPFVNRDLRFGKKLRDSKMIDSLWEGLQDPISGMLMGETAELLAEEFKISRKEQDAFALASHQKAVRAIASGSFKEEILPIPLSFKAKRIEDHSEKLLAEDEGPNPALNSQMLAELLASFKQNGSITAGNACSISDGAAAVLVTTRVKAEKLGLEILAKVRSWAFVGTEPKKMGLGPVEATKKALRKGALSLKDIQLVEINEAFAAQYLAVEQLLKVDRAITNVHGGAIALGHPVGATGARIVVTLLHAMKKRNAGLGLASLCIGGGQGGSIILERF